VRAVENVKDMELEHLALRTNRLLRVSLWLTATAMGLLLSAAAYQWHQPNLAGAFARDARTHIKHVVIIAQENRSFDNLFHGYPGADWASSGLAHDGRRIPLRPISFLAPYDIGHGFAAFISAYDGGKMDRFDLAKAGRRPGAIGKRAILPDAAYGFVPRNETESYYQMARQYVLADRMFQSNLDENFAAHLYLIAGQAAHAVNTLLSEHRLLSYPCGDASSVRNEVVT